MVKYRAASFLAFVMVFLLAIMFVLFMHGIMPGVMLPTLGQVVVVSGYSASFANQDVFSIYSEFFGYPKPAPIATGLVFSLPAALLIKAGLHPADAYSSIAAIFFIVAFAAAFRIGQMFGLTKWLAILGALLWLSMPVIWGHAGYAMLCVGIALLPFYFWTALNFFRCDGAYNEQHYAKSAALYVAACLIAIFVDGYSFMMFAVGSSILAGYLYVRFRERRLRFVKFLFPVHVAGFALAYILFVSYIGRMQYDPSPLEFFRGWGADLTFFAAPSFGKHWLWDALGLSVLRPGTNFFGDPSVWITTFTLPLAVAGLAAWWRTRTQNAFATFFLLVAVFGFYMSLGPSLKINSTRPQEMIAAGQLDGMMPSELAVASTGSAWLSENLPGFKNMRASYRWSALGMFGLWALIVLMLSRERGWAKFFILIVVVFLIVSNLPHIDRKWKQDISYRDKFFRIDKELVADFGEVLSRNELIAFLPYRNDFLVTYLAPRLGIRTYNIGGDKSLFEALKHWPTIMQQFQMGMVDANFADRVLLLLIRKEADAVVLPYIDMLSAAAAWPSPLIYKNELMPIVDVLRASKYVTVEERKHYSVIRLAEPYRSKYPGGKLEEEIITSIAVYPLNPPRSVWILPEGWHDAETGQVWSKEHSVLNLAVPEKCTGKACYAVIKFGVFGASEQRPVTIRFALNGGEWVETLTVRKVEGHSLAISMAGRKGMQKLSIETTNATSPHDLGLSIDPRVLGIALRLVDIGTIVYPIQVGPKAETSLALALKDGWHAPEAGHVWSMERARLNLPVPEKCQGQACFVTLRFAVFGASEQTPVQVRLTLQGGGKSWAETIVAKHPEQSIAIPIAGQRGIPELLIEVPDATSPQKRGLSADPRVLGIALRMVDIGTIVKQQGTPIRRP